MLAEAYEVLCSKHKTNIDRAVLARNSIEWLHSPRNESEQCQWLLNQDNFYMDGLKV